MASPITFLNNKLDFKNYDLFYNEGILTLKLPFIDTHKRFNGIEFDAIKRQVSIHLKESNLTTLPSNYFFSNTLKKYNYDSIIFTINIFKLVQLELNTLYFEEGGKLVILFNVIVE